MRPAAITLNRRTDVKPQVFDRRVGLGGLQPFDQLAFAKGQFLHRHGIGDVNMQQAAFQMPNANHSSDLGSDLKLQRRLQLLVRHHLRVAASSHQLRHQRADGLHASGWRAGRRRPGMAYRAARRATLWLAARRAALGLGPRWLRTVGFRNRLTKSQHCSSAGRILRARVGLPTPHWCVGSSRSYPLMPASVSVQNASQSTGSDPLDNSELDDLLVLDPVAESSLAAETSSDLAAAGSDTAGGFVIDQLGQVAVPPLDYSAFRQWPFSDMYGNVVLVLALTAFAVACVWSCGLAVKLASRFIGGRRVTVRQGMAASCGAAVAFLLVFPVQQVFATSVSPLLTLLAAFLLALLAFALVLRENPLRVTATAAISCLLGGLFSAGLLYVATTVIATQVPQVRIDRLAEHTRPFSDSIIQQYGPESDEERESLREQWTLDSLRRKREAVAAETQHPNAIRDRNLRDNPFTNQAD